MAWAAVIGAGGAIAGGLIAKSGSKQSGSATSTTQLDPRAQGILYGDGTSGNQGLLSQYQSLLNKPQDSSLQGYGNANLDYLKNYGNSDLGALHDTSTALMSRGVQTPSIGAASASLPAYAVGNMTQAPAQNNMNLTGTFSSLLNGGNNQALQSSLKYGTDLTNAQFAKNQTDLTNNLTRNVLPGISQNAVLAGQYGGSRQGVAEGNAISDYTNQLTNANTQIGLANSANTTGQLANDYEQGQGRALAAAQGLSQQQYATALQDANTKNAAEFMNVGNSFDASKTNAGLTQQSNLANQNALLQTNSLNNTTALAGAGLLSGLNTQAYGVGQNQNNYQLNQYGGINSLLQPYLGTNSGSSTSRPLYQNTAGDVLGGAAAGLSLYNQYKQANAPASSGVGSSGSYAGNDWLTS